MRSISKKLAIYIFIVVSLSTWLALFFVRPIDIGSGDIGRHLKNGEIIVSSLKSGEGIHNLLNTNYYSYTHTEFPFVNHHWGTGVVLYLVWSVGGFVGLQVFGFLLALATLLFSYNLAIKRSSLYVATPFVFLITPLLANRRNIRPELFSYLFIAVLLWLLYSYKETRDKKLLYIIPFLFLLWINLHIYFIFGLFILGVFILDEAKQWNKRGLEVKKLSMALVTSLLLMLINPFGIKAIIYPFTVFGNYGIEVSEIASVTKANAVVFSQSIATTFYLSLFVLLVSLLYLMISKRKESLFVDTVLAIIFSALAWMIVRNIAMFAIVTLPIISASVCMLVSKLEIWENKNTKYSFVAISLVIVLGISFTRIPHAWSAVGSGITIGSQEAGEFIRDNDISGPLINDFNSGGYASWYLFPELQLFVDNRPEAFPANFFVDEYTPMLIDEDVWYKVEEKYSPNVILLGFEGAPKQVTYFTAKRIQDPGWVPVFINKKHIVLVKKHERNARVINEFAIPDSVFSF